MNRSGQPASALVGNRGRHDQFDRPAEHWCARVCQRKIPALRGFKTAIFANVFGYAPEDYAEVIRVLEDAQGIAGYELNVSCPNTKHGGIYFSSDPALLSDLINLVRPLAAAALIVKLSPNVAASSLWRMAAEQSGADAISLVNTFVSLAIDAHTRRPRIGAGFGGLSGPAIKPIALRFVYEACQGSPNSSHWPGRNPQRRGCCRISGSRRLAPSKWARRIFGTRPRLAASPANWIDTWNKRNMDSSKTGGDFTTMRQTFSTESGPKPLARIRRRWSMAASRT